MLDLLKLETFRTVANTRSFTRAGAELGYSQSTVTAHIQSLEREIGSPLFERTRFSREISLTETGERTLDYAARLLALAQETSLALQSQSEPGGRVRVCAHPLLLAHRLSRLFRDYEVKYPRAKMAISAYSDPRILAASVLNGTADVGFVLDEPITSDRFISESLGREKVVAVCSPDHRLAQSKGGITIRELAQNQVLFSDTNCSVRMLFERVLMGAGTRMDNTVEAGSVDAVKHCAMAGIGFGVLPLFAIEREIRAKELTIIPLVDTDMTVEVQIIRHPRDRVSPAVHALRALVIPQAPMSTAA
jgi:DNA-binding transcriptional LysR family regulator